MRRFLNLPVLRRRQTDRVSEYIQANNVPAELQRSARGFTTHIGLHRRHIHQIPSSAFLLILTLLTVVLHSRNGHDGRCSLLCADDQTGRLALVHSELGSGQPPSSASSRQGHTYCDGIDRLYWSLSLQVASWEMLTSYNKVIFTNVAV